MRLETARLLVRELRASDAAALHAVLSDPEVMHWLEPPFTPAQTERFIREAGLCEPPLVYAVLRKDSGELIGQLIWHAWGESAAELGWVLRRDCWGLGFAKELTAAMLAQSEGAVVIECSPGQSASRHIAERFGFTLTGEADGLVIYRLNKRQN